MYPRARVRGGRALCASACACSCACVVVCVCLSLSQWVRLCACACVPHVPFLFRAQPLRVLLAGNGVGSEDRAPGRQRHHGKQRHPHRVIGLGQRAALPSATLILRGCQLGGAQSSVLGR